MTPLDLWAESRRARDVRSLPRTLLDATLLVWRAGRPNLITVSVLQLVTGLLLAAQVLIGREALQAILDAERGEATLRDAAIPLVAIAVAAALGSLSTPLLLQQQRLLGELVQRATYDQILDVTESVDLVSFESPDFFDRLQRVQAHAVPQPMLVTQGLVQLLGGLAGVAALVVALLAIEPLLVPLLLCAGVPLALLSRHTSASEFAFAVEQTSALRLREYLRYALTGRDEAKEVRSFGAQRLLRERYDALWRTYLDSLRGHIRSRMRLAVVSTVLVTAATAGTLLVLLLFVVRNRISLAEAGAAAIAVRLLSSRMEMLVTAAGRLFESALFLDDMHAFRALRRPDVDAPSAAGPPGFEVLEARGIHFRYPAGNHDVLTGVDLQLRRGEVVALVGDNGSGKTTLIKILASLYAPSAGELTWDGVDVSRLDPGQVRRRVAVVFQHFVRFALPARENIALGYRDDLAEVENSARAAGADDFLAALPQGYDTVLSAEFAGGTDLSGGEWQRVAIARALHRDAALVLLDEPTAALDPRAEQRLFEAVRGTLADRAVVVVSHRFSTVRSADRILVMAGGRVVEAGTHEELIAAGGHYADMYVLQRSAEGGS
ncbi:MAG TPA: ABC transporter ATP-binding protein [Mycobacteriales bacterium]|nr:ABC transporter ATP-binding protein [Mycobacteriales bacterium]